jgi:Mg2+ and Co2+ transporter CorA
MGKGSQADNNNMRPIAVVGLVYLPATFVSGLFGMNFCQFGCDAGHQDWKVSDKFWLYWAITVPLTLATALVWVLAFHGQSLKLRKLGRKMTLAAAGKACGA